MKITTETTAKNKSVVNVCTEDGTVVGSVAVSKSRGVAARYLADSSGPKSVYFNELIAKCKRIELGLENDTADGYPSTEVEIPEAPQRSGITKMIRKAFMLGFKIPKEVFAYLDSVGYEYNPNSVYALVWEERKKEGLPGIRPRGKVDIAESPTTPE